MTSRTIRIAALAIAVGVLAYLARAYRVRQANLQRTASVAAPAPAPAPVPQPAAPSPYAPGPGGPKPNIVLIVVDTLRSDQVSSYAEGAPPTPNIDGLAAAGVSFDTVFSAAPWTAPSLISIMTGLYPSTHGVWGYPNPAAMADEQVTLAEILKTQGYATAAFTEGGFARPDFGLGQGFDQFPTHAGDDEGNFSNLTSAGRTEENLQRALAWLAAAPKEPFFVFYHTYGPHFPYDVPDDLLERPVPAQGDIGAKVQDICRRFEAEQEITDEDIAVAVVAIHRLGEFRLGIPADDRCYRIVRRAFSRPIASLARVIDDVRTLYRGKVRLADQTVGRFLAALETRPNTIVLLTSDHGEGMGEHEIFQHGVHLHRELLQVPLVLRLPQAGLRGRRIPGIVRTIDIMPTLAALAGASPPSGTPGKSFLPLLDAASPDGRIALSEAVSIIKRERVQRALRTDDWAVFHRRGANALYDARRDPGELVDLAGTRPDVLGRLVPQMMDSFAAFERPADAAPLRVPEVDERELRALGYAQ